MTATVHNAIRDPERRATLAFLSIQGVGPGTLRVLREEFGSLAEALEAGHSQYKVHLRSDADVEHAENAAARADDIAEYCAANDVQILCPGDAAWPWRVDDLSALRTKDDKPACLMPELLYLRGTLDSSRRAVGIVGTRHPSKLGLRAGHQLGAAAARHAVVVSGGASGIDTSAHEGALSLGGTTWVVLGHGFKRTFPAENGPLFERIVAGGGALITEFAPDHETKQANFARRNRLIAALSEILVVVQGQVDSGAMITARDVMQLNAAVPEHRRMMLAMPGGLEDPLADGPNMLLRQGAARACQHSSDLLVALGVEKQLAVIVRDPNQLPAKSATGRRVFDLLGAEPRRPVTPPAAVEPELEPVFAALGPAPMHFDTLASSVGWQAPQLLAALTQLEVLGLCEQKPGKLFLRRSE